MAEKSLALVLRTIDFSETSLVVTLFTREFGKIQALAKGGRRPKGPFESALDLLAVCRIVFLRKSSETLNLLTEAKLERRFRAAATDLSRLYAAFYVAELLREMTDEGDPHPELFDAAVDTLFQLDQGTAAVPSLVLNFELAALRLLGHLPALSECVECGQAVPVAGRVAFGLLAGGVLCGRCRPGKKQVISVTGPALEILRAFATAETCPANFDRRLAGELRGVMNQYLCHLLGFRPQMHKYSAMLAG